MAEYELLIVEIDREEVTEYDELTAQDDVILWELPVEKLGALIA